MMQKFVIFTIQVNSNINFNKPYIIISLIFEKFSKNIYIYSKSILTIMKTITIKELALLK